MSTVDLVCLTGSACPFEWGLGTSLVCRPEPAAVTQAIEHLAETSAAAAVLFWDPSLGKPDETFLQELLASPADCCHGGLKLGRNGLPGILGFISPAWMLACDPPSDLEATSWRLSLRACLVKKDVFRKLGGLRPEFRSLDGAALEMGHRWIRQGALMRHVPRLVPECRGPALEMAHGTSEASAPGLSFEDELRFAFYRHGRKWAWWALFRAVSNRYVPLTTAGKSAWRVLRTRRPALPEPLRTEIPAGLDFDLDAQVTVLIPTVDRYPYLRTLLDQLRRQTVPPLEIIVVDQTARERRDQELGQDFRDLPLKVVCQDEPGQCRSRNAGLQMARGDYILFLDDDDEVPPDLIEAHLRSIKWFGAGASSGVADEIGAGPLPSAFCFLRASDVFPTNNTLVRREVLRRSGLFDLAYDRGQRADGDLGMRVYLSGALMVLNPAISVLHHHAPAGGLRNHKARTVTYAMSRNRAFSRALTSASEMYLAWRYFPTSHLREMLWQNVLGTFSIRGGVCRRLFKAFISLVSLPQTLWLLRCRKRQALLLSGAFPQIATLPGNTEGLQLRANRPVLHS